MQVMLDDGYFHREMDHTTTACEQPIPHVGQWRRVKKYDGRLCPHCYSAAEIARAEAANAAELERITGEHVPLTRTGEQAQEIQDWLNEPPKPPRRRTPTRKDTKP